MSSPDRWCHAVERAAERILLGYGERRDQAALCAEAYSRMIKGEEHAPACGGRISGLPGCIKARTYQACPKAADERWCLLAERIGQLVAAGATPLLAGYVCRREGRGPGGSRLETDAMKVAREYVGDPAVRVLVLAGPTGVGKSYASTWIASRFLPPPSRGRFHTGDDVFRDPLFADLRTVRPFEQADAERLERPNLLLLEDVGTEPLNDPLRAVFDRVFNTRYGESTRTVITTNSNLTEFKARYGERVIDRMREVGRFVELVGVSLRGKP